MRIELTSNGVDVQKLQKGRLCFDSNLFHMCLCVIRRSAVARRGLAVVSCISCLVTVCFVFCLTSFTYRFGFSTICTLPYHFVLR